MNELLAHESDAVWENIAPHLDTALGELSEPDRDALLLRYFERKSAREMARTLGVSDEAAQKRVNRAVERLRELFVKRGVTIGASGLVVIISSNAVQAAPIGLAVTIFSSALATTLAIATHTTMHWINFKSVAAILAAAITAGTVTHLVQQQEANRLLSENQNLASLNLALSKERDAALSAFRTNDTDPEQLRKEKSELLRLRSDVSRLRKEASELANLKKENIRLRSGLSSLPNQQVIETMPAGQTNFPVETWAFVGYATPEAALQSWTWAMSKGDKQFMLSSLVPEAQKDWIKRFANQSEEALAAEGARGTKNFTGFAILDHEVRSETDVDLTVSMATTNGQSKAMKMTVQKIDNEWKIVGPSKNQ